MSVAGNAESVLVYSFVDYIPFKDMSFRDPTGYQPIVKYYYQPNGDQWCLEFNKYGHNEFIITFTLSERSEVDCSFNVKLTVFDENRQSKFESVKKGWNYVKYAETFEIPTQVAADLRKTSMNQMALQMTITKVVKPSMAEEYSRLFKSESFGDVEIECADGVKFHCHKDMLVARSHHFATMFNLKMKESVENRIRIEDFNNDVMSILLQFCYLGDWGDLSGVADHLYKAADRYELDQLKLAARAELIVNLNAESIVSTLRLAQLHNDKSLVDGCADYLACHKDSLLEVMAEAAKIE